MRVRVRVRVQVRGQVRGQMRVRVQFDDLRTSCRCFARRSTHGAAAGLGLLVWSVRCEV